MGLRAILGLANNGTFNNPTFTGVAKFADGSATSPSITFSSATENGFYVGTNGVIVAGAGAASVFLGNNGSGSGCVGVSSGGFIGFTAGLPTATVDTYLARGAAGVFKFANTGSFSANGAVATTLGSVGPTGSHTTVQTWLTFQDSGGVTRYVPCF